MIVVTNTPLLYYYYQTHNDTQSAATFGMRNKLCFTTTPAFCYIAAPITAMLAIFGIVSNIRTFLSTIRNKPWGHRLSHYVQALCLWDASLLTGILTLKALFCLQARYKPMELWSPMEALLALSLSPLVDVCVTGSTWVIVAITADRYMAVSQPLRERTRSERSVKWISAAIVIFSMAINLPRSIYEYHMSDCVNWRVVHIEETEDNRQTVRFYIMFGRIIPDLLFRSPIPILISIFLTFKIVKHCGKRLSRKEHRNLLPNVSNNSGVHSISSKADNLKSPWLLFMLNGKFLVCSVMYIGSTAVLWLDNHPISDLPGSLVQTLKEFGTLLIVVHSATNWIFFHKVRQTFLRSHPHPILPSQERLSLERELSVPDYVIFDASEKHCLTSIWAKIDVSKLGTKLLITLLENNPSLIKSICPQLDDGIFDRDELLRQPRISFVGSRINQFVEQMMKTLNDENMTKEDFAQIRMELRSIGIVHFVERVKITNQDWFLTKRFLVDLMMERCEKGDLREHTNVANKFASFIIHEMKNGYMCEAARVAHQSNSQFDQDQQALGGVFPISTAVVHKPRHLNYSSSCPSMYSPEGCTTLPTTLSTPAETSSMLNVAHDYIASIDARGDADVIIFV
uniref:G-protein coupled receptors family 1 profile domain-containing protein n=1 Tax=Plectus sambesii TaxID=2011161 RepID=A0A914WKC3_9BILA